MKEFTLEEMLIQDTRKTIISTADMLGIKINKSHRKADIAKRVSETILAIPMHLLRQLPFREVSNYSRWFMPETMLYRKTRHL